MPAFPSLVGPTYQGQSRLAANERCTGFYLERNETQGAEYPWTLNPLPGLSLLLTTAEGPGRGNWAQAGRCLAVQGQRLYELINGVTITAVDRGAVANDLNPATLASSGDGGEEVAIASGGSIFIFDLVANTLSPAIAGLTAHQVDYLDGRFLGLDMDSSTFRISDQFDGTTWDPTQETQRSTASDPWQSLLVSGQYIFIFGSETTDVYYDAGTSPFPFAPVAGSLIPAGIAAPWSAKNLAGMPVWLTQDKDGARSVVRANGTGYPQRISTMAIEYRLRNLSTVADGQGSCYTLDGHAMYRLSFPTAGATFMYDNTSQQWTEDPYFNPITAREEASRAVNHCYAFGKHIVGDRSTGAIYDLSPTTYTHNGDAIHRIRQVAIPKLTDSEMWVFLSNLEIHMDVGIGLSVADGALGRDPMVQLEMSRDSGNTFGSAIAINAGEIGEYFTRVVFNRLGRYRDGRGVVRLTFTDPVPWRISGASIDARVGTS